MDTQRPGHMIQITSTGQQSDNNDKLQKRINDEKDVIFFRSQSPAYKNTLAYVDSLCELLQGSAHGAFSKKYQMKDDNFKKCATFLELLGKCCAETELNLDKTAGSLRYGHVAFRDWCDVMESHSSKFIDELAFKLDAQYKKELLAYLTQSFGHRMRIDYGTGHELNFIIFTMGLCDIVETPEDCSTTSMIDTDRLKAFVNNHGWDILSLFAHKYLRLCRAVQKKFRLEPAGSRGVYNMDDFQFLPFLFGTAQLIGKKYISTSDFFEPDQVIQFKDEFIFFEALEFILDNKRGPFHEHSYTLWCFTNLGSWDNIFRRIRAKFIDDVLRPFPVVQHLLFGQYIFRWNP